jgi:hypothetical protein
MCAIPTPPSYDDIIQFEDDNKLCINITTINQHSNAINPDQLGNLKYLHTGQIDSLLGEDEEGDQTHYIYIKHRKTIAHSNLNIVYKTNHTVHNVKTQYQQ